MESGNTPVIDIAAILGQAQQASYRLALTNKDGQWSVYSLVLEVFPQPAMSSAPTFAYDYGRAAFVAGTIPGDVAQSWLLEKRGSVAAQGDAEREYSFELPSFHETASWQRLRSHDLYGLVSLPWPHTLYELGSRGGQSSDVGFLVNTGCPFFPNFDTAVLSLVHHWNPPDEGRTGQPAYAPVIVRIAHAEAWIEAIHLSSASIEVTVAGPELAGTSLTVSSPPDVQEQVSTQDAGPVRIPLPNGVPSPLWIVLARGSQWLDYYQRDTRWSAFNRAQANVTTDPSDLRTEIEALRFQGEGPTVEFKEVVPDDSDRMLKTIAAFANGDGGVILLGVRDRTGDLVGIKDDVAIVKDQIINMIRNTVVPQPEVRFESAELEHRTILAIYVNKGQQTPYGLYPQEQKTQYFVRRGANTFRARPDEIRAAVLNSQPQRPPFGYPGRLS